MSETPSALWTLREQNDKGRTLDIINKWSKWRDQINLVPDFECWYGTS